MSDSQKQNDNETSPIVSKTKQVATDSAIALELPFTFAGAILLAGGAGFSLAGTRAGRPCPRFHGATRAREAIGPVVDLRASAVSVRLDRPHRLCYFCLSEYSPLEHDCGLVRSCSSCNCGECVGNLGTRIGSFG